MAVEARILQMIADDKTCPQIADELCLSLWSGKPSGAEFSDVGPRNGVNYCQIAGNLLILYDF